MVPNHVFKVQDRAMDFNVTEKGKFMDRISESTLQLLSKELVLAECVGIKEQP